MSLDSMSLSSHCPFWLSLLSTWPPPRWHLSLLREAHLTDVSSGMLRESYALCFSGR